MTSPTGSCHLCRQMCSSCVFGLQNSMLNTEPKAYIPTLLIWKPLDFLVIRDGGWGEWVGASQCGS
jgi:hypothetical protein